ncbi:hypothetical protein [Actinoplanes sp. G11-F43]
MTGVGSQAIYQDLQRHQIDLSTGREESSPAPPRDGEVDRLIGGR